MLQASLAQDTVIWLQQRGIVACFPCLFSCQSPWLLSSSTIPHLTPYMRGIPPPLLAPQGFSIHICICMAVRKRVLWSIIPFLFLWHPGLNSECKSPGCVQFTFQVWRKAYSVTQLQMKRTLFNLLFTWPLCENLIFDHSSMP